MHVFFSVGEPSGDQHAAHLMAELKRRDPAVRCSGFGGPLMERQGLESLYRLTDLAVMGIGGVLPLINTFRGLAREAREFLQREKPDVCVLIDFPGFNWHIARAAKEAGVEVVYYCPPQLWAWATWRFKKMRRTVDRVLSVLPFEADWYRERKMPVDYVGHPFFDEIAEKRLDETSLTELRNKSPRRVALLPGSRNQEVHRNFPVMIQIAKRVVKRHPDVRFPLACYKESHRDYCQSLLAQEKSPPPIDLYCGKTSEIIETADCLLMVSGSVSLEVLARGKPAAVMYHGSLLMGTLTWFLIHCKYMSLPNLIAGRMVMPERPFMVRVRKHTKWFAGILDNWLSDPAAMESTRQEMAELRANVATTGGIVRAVDSLLRTQKTIFRKAA